MLNIQLKECTNCSSIQETMCQLDTKLASMTRSMYNNDVYLTDRPVCKRKFKDLLYYRDMLNSLLFNPDYFCGAIEFSKIISKIKTLVK